MKPLIHAALLLLLLAATQSCSSMSAPTLLGVANDPATAEQKPITDKAIFQFSDQLKAWWGSRSTKAEVFGTGTLIAMDALTTAALASSGGGFGVDLTRGLIAGVDFIKAVYQRIDPKARDGAFNSGSSIVLESQGEYLACITQKRAAVPSDKHVSPCGAKFLSKVNSAIVVVGNLMVGTLAPKGDLENVLKPVTAAAE